MKKILAVLLALAMLLCLCACNSSDNQNTDPGDSNQSIIGDTDSSKDDADSSKDDEDSSKDDEDSSKDDEDSSKDDADSSKDDEDSSKDDEDSSNDDTEKPDNSVTPPATCSHSWSNATCTAPKTCSKCGVTEGSAAGHSWKNATCTAPKTCGKCGTTEGSATGHSYSNGTCSVCGTADPNYNQSTTCSHSWKNATCTAPKTCSKCGATEGSAAGHSWKDATCTAPKTCSTCGATEGKTTNHTWDRGTCTTPMKCMKCGAVDGKARGHNWVKATCTAPKTCSECSATEGKAAGHSWNKATCTAPKSCKNCDATEGTAAGHSWKTTSDATVKKCTKCGATASTVPVAGDLFMHANYDEKASTNAAKLTLRNGLAMTWDSEYAYLVYSGNKPAVTFEDKKISFTDVSKGAVNVMKVKLETLGIDPSDADRTRTASIGDWNGYVTFEWADVESGDKVDQFIPLSDAYFDANVAQRQATVEGNTYTFSGVEQSMGFQNIAVLDFTGVNVVEFDFKPISMIKWGNFGGLQGSSGAILFFITNGVDNKVGFAINQDSPDGQNPNDLILTSMPGTSGNYTTYDYVNLTDTVGLDMNGTIHIRVEVHNYTDKAPTLKYYIDGKLVLVDEKVAFDDSMKTSIPGYANGFAVIIGKYETSLEMSNVTFSKEATPVATPTGKAPVDGDLVMHAKYDQKAASNAAKISLMNGLGVTWDDEYAYIVHSGMKIKPVVFIGGKRIPSTTVSDNVMKAKLTALGVNPTEGTSTIAIAIGNWSGYVVFEKMDVVGGDEVAHSTPLTDAYYKPDIAQSQAEIKDNTYYFSKPEQSMGFGGDSGPIDALKAGGTSVIEFDFNATKIFTGAYWNGVQGTNGPILFYIRDDIENIFGFAIIRDHEDNQYKLVAAPQGAHTYVTLPEFALNKTMHVRIEIDHDPDETTCMRYYVDGKLVLTHKDAAYTPLENVTGVYAQGMMVLVGNYASDFTLSNVSFGIQ